MAAETMMERFADLLSDFSSAVLDDCASFERGNGHRDNEVREARKAVLAEYDALRRRYEEAMEALADLLPVGESLLEGATALEHGNHIDHCPICAPTLKARALIDRHREDGDG